MNSNIYITTSVLWSIYYSDDFFTNISIRYRRGLHRYQHTISEKMSPNSTYYIVDFLTELSAYYYHTQGRLQDLIHGGGGAEPPLGLNHSENYYVKFKNPVIAPDYGWGMLYTPLHTAFWLYKRIKRFTRNKLYFYAHTFKIFKICITM